MDSHAVCANYTMPTADEFNHSTAGMLHQHHTDGHTMTTYRPTVLAYRQHVVKIHQMRIWPTYYYYYNHFTAPWTVYRTTRVSWYQKGKTKKVKPSGFTGAGDSEWQWHQLGHMQICTLPQTENHASIPPLCFITGRMPLLPPNQQRQSTEGNKFGLHIQPKN